MRMESVISITIRPARSTKDLEAAARLFTTYATFLGLDLGFQGFSTEVNTLPGKYGPPKGEILLAYDPQENAIGCVAVRPLPLDGYCEMKRLYVTPAGRGLGLGRRLVDAILKTAGDLRYREIRLDSLPSMHKACELYERSGFKRIEPYYETPLVDTIFYARRLPV